MLEALLAALKFAPSVLSAGTQIYQAITGKEVDPSVTPEALTGMVSTLPPEQQAEIQKQVLLTKAQIEAFDTQRFMELTAGDAEKVHATARPEIALRAMAMLETFMWVFKMLMLITIVQWLTYAIYDGLGVTAPFTHSFWDLLAKAQPVQEMIWAPLLASFYAALQVITKYMGCRERDKAQEYEIQNGGVLKSTDAIIAAAGGGVANIIRAARGK